VILKLTETVFVQDSHLQGINAPDWIILGHEPVPGPTRISHVVNFYGGTSSARRIQELTAESMRRTAASTRDVRLLAVLSAAESSAAPAGFKCAPKLRRTVADVQHFTEPRPFPLLFDILASGAAAAKPNSYLIFTNSDICIQPNFYSIVRHFLERGVDCLIINRRTVASVETYGDAPELASLEVGSRHPGFDCFVFPAVWLNDFVSNHACVGVGFVMRSLLFNLVVKARRMLILRDAHLTYHYGDDRPWNTPEFKEYTEHNVREAQSIVRSLSTDPVRQKALEDFCVAHNEIYPDGKPVIAGHATAS
jgi:hypothetical protein